MADVQVAAWPIFVGIGGDSGSGKTTLTAAFYSLFGEDRIATVCLDDYHSLDRRQRALVGLTPLNPRANNFALMEEHLWALKRGDAVEKPVYDHRRGTFGDPQRLEPREVVIVQGLHPFLVPGIRHIFDLKVWLDPEPALRAAWKLRRDVARRGYSRAQVLAELEARRADAEAYIQPQRRWADLVVRFQPPTPGWRKDMGHLDVRITQRHTLPRLSFDRCLHRTDRVRLFLDVVDEDGQRSDVIEIEGTITAPEAELVERIIWEHIDGVHGSVHHVPPERLGTYDAARGQRHSDPLALTQLILAHRILSAQKSMMIRLTTGQHEALTQRHLHL